MKLFQIKTAPLGVERLTEFLEDNYVSIGYPGLGNLEYADRDEIGRRLIQSGAYQDVGHGSALENLYTFVHIMQDGDYVVAADGEYVHLGDLGDYFYDELFDHEEDGRCHRRGVTWLKSLPRTALNPLVNQLLEEEAQVSLYTGALPSARLDLWLTGTEQDSTVKTESAESAAAVDKETIAEAIAVLRDALHSDDPGRRERAAIAILQYAK
jgi:predicted Mrr-cat superfamily restriction endonuclease